jgi:hypothetical protein
MAALRGRARVRLVDGPGCTPCRRDFRPCSMPHCTRHAQASPARRDGLAARDDAATGRPAGTDSSVRCFHSRIRNCSAKMLPLEAILSKPAGRTGDLCLPRDNRAARETGRPGFDGPPMRSSIWIGILIGSTIGGMIPLVWGDDMLSYSSVLLGGAGAFAGLWVGYKMSA